VYKIFSGICCLFYYCRFSDVTIITALLRHSAYVIVEGKVVKMKQLNKYQLRAQAVIMFEENYSYSVIAKKLSRSKVWVSKSTRRSKTNLAESLQSQSWQRLTDKTGLNLTAQRIIRKIKYQVSPCHIPDWPPT